LISHEQNAEHSTYYCDLQNKWGTLRRNFSSKLVQITVENSHLFRKSHIYTYIVYIYIYSIHAYCDLHSDLHNKWESRIFPRTFLVGFTTSKTFIAVPIFPLILQVAVYMRAHFLLYILFAKARGLMHMHFSARIISDHKRNMHLLESLCLFRYIRTYMGLNEKHTHIPPHERAFHFDT
jgi:hypothetical protein